MSRKIFLNQFSLMLIRASETKEERPSDLRGSSTVTFASVEVRTGCIEHCLDMLLQYNTCSTF